jgi:hypothetical protein
VNPVKEDVVVKANKAFVSRMSDIKKLWDEWCNGKHGIEEYGLSFDYVTSGTFNDQKEGYFRWQLSGGSPSEEFRFYTDAAFNVYRIEFVFMDWFEKHVIWIEEGSYYYETMLDIFDGLFKESGECRKVVDECM